jgi:NAD(P)-dependent dehydrogenase (short-subunit alcohol dehydrogenase family)
MKLKDKVAIITGGGTGMGKGIAGCFVQQGAIVVLAQRRIEQAQATAQELAVDGGVARAISCDVSYRDQVRHLSDLLAGKPNVSLR